MTSPAPKPPAAFSDFVGAHPDVGSAYENLGQAVKAAGPLTAREVALVKLGIAVGARMEGAARANARKANASGIEQEALEHVAILSCPTIGFPNMIAAWCWVREALGQ
jgi:alkylhydroperoxidase/carboxymuconolactone decarboxylase family protein YurZ